MPFTIKKIAMRLRNNSEYIPLPGVRGEDGADGVSPAVSFTTITGGHTMTVTDKDHPLGQSINIMDGESGGGGTSDYEDLSNKPSINGNTLSGNKTAADLGLGTYNRPSGGIPKSDLASAVQTSLDKADSALQSAPVTSVNSKTGAVSLSASDVGALPAGTAIPSKTSDLTNDSGFITSAPVTSVNTKTGAVTLTASDVGAGTYSKPSSGIPASDLASAVQTSLGKADSALQSVPSTYRTAAEQDAIDADMAKADEVGIVITGKRPSMAVTEGQYVIVRNSTISGITDGLYTANAALSPSTDVTAANLTAVSGGGLNSLKSQIETVSTASSSITKLVSSGTLDNRTCVKKGNVVTAGGRIYGMTDNDGSQRAYFQIPEGFRPTVQDAKCMGAVKVLSSTNPTFPTTPIFVPTVVSIGTDGQVMFGGGQFANSVIDQVLFAGTYVV